MTRASDSPARTPLRERWLAISMLAAALATTACGGQAATPSATSVAISRPSVSPTTASASTVSASTAAGPPPTESPAPVPGGLLAYGRFRPDGAYAFTANTDGTAEQALLPSISECPRFSPDGRRLAVTAQSPQGLLFFGLVNRNGSGYKRFASPDPTLNLGCPAWSPDASRLASEGFDDSHPARNGIYTVRASDGGGLTRVTTSPGGGHDVVGGYSPDGRQIVFIRGIHVDEGEQNTLMVVNVDGSDPRVLTDRKVRLGSRWSPDGKVILTESAGSLLLVPVDGGQPSPITIDAGSALNALGGGWSPDGTWIVFSRVTSTGEDIYIMRKDGTNLHQITDTPGVDEEFGEWSVPAS